MHPFYTLHLSLSLMTVSVLQKVFVRKFDFFVCLYKSIPQHVLVLLYNFLFMQVICLLSEEGRHLKKCVDFDFISLLYSYVYIHAALCYQEFYLQGSCNNFGRATFCIVEISFSYISIDC